MNSIFNVGTFNVRTLQSEIRKKQLSKDLENYKLDIVCLQETKIQEGVDITIDGNRLICFKSDSRYYGCGFLVSRKWIGNIYRTWRVTDRICVIQFKIDIHKQAIDQGKTNIISIINIYAPTSQRAAKFPEETQGFYSDLNNTIETLGNKTILFIGGDFNAKVGKYEEGETCIGHFSKGKRNDNGNLVIDLCENNKLFISNSAFDHPARHQTTWVGRLKDKATDKIINIFNQIDYIICQQRHKQCLTNSRSYSGTLLSSDHKLVKTSFILKNQKLWKKPVTHRNIQTRVNIPSITTDQESRLTFQRLLDLSFKAHGLDSEAVPARPTSDKLRDLQSIVKTTSIETLGVTTNDQKHKQNNVHILALSNKQKNLRIKIQNTSNNEAISKLKSERNKILHDIRKRLVNVKNEEIERKIEQIDLAQNDHAMFKATKILNQKTFENPQIEDTDEKLVTNPDDILDIVSAHFKGKFFDEQVAGIEPFLGDPRALNNPISPAEVRKSFNSLSNNKSPGEDGIHAELLKHGTSLLDNITADIFNLAFQKHENLNINEGILVAIQKPGKRKGPPSHLRPITLLNALRKALSIIVLNRIKPLVEKYLSLSQSGFRTDRSTSDVVWTHKWLAAKTLREDVTIKISGIDMSAAFDTIDRHKLLDILQTIIQEDEHRIIRFLLSNTKINTRIIGKSKTNTFNSNIGTPQGDSLSPVLFIIYLEHALKDARLLLATPSHQYHQEIPNELAYADDVDFIGQEYADINSIQQTLERHNLKVNADKTEFTLISKKEDSWRKVKKVGSLIGDEEDVQRRQHLSTVALNKLNHLWAKGSKLKIATRLKLYKSLVKSILLYNCGNWALTKTQEEKINAFHRRQLRRILNIRYPIKISNRSLYRKCLEKPLSIQITSARWRLFGHILRRDKDIPANKATRAYFIENNNRLQGRPKTTLPIVLNRDLTLVNHQFRLNSASDLDKLTELAQDRCKWRKLVTEIEKEAEATQTEHWDATRP